MRSDKKKLYEYAERRLRDPEAIAQAPDPAAPNTLIYKPTPKQTATFSNQRALTCGSCRYFRKDHFGDNAKARRDFLLVLVHEFGWKVRHLCDDPKDMAVCGQRDVTIVGPNTKACEYYSDRKATIVPIDALRRKPR